MEKRGYALLLRAVGESIARREPFQIFAEINITYKFINGE